MIKHPSVGKDEIYDNTGYLFELKDPFPCSESFLRSVRVFVQMSMEKKNSIATNNQQDS